MANKKDFIAPPPQETDVPRSKFDLSHNNNLTLKFGQAYPCLVVDAPGNSTYKIRPSMGFDFFPFRTSVQSNVRAHLKFYKIPKRILWENFEAWKYGHGTHVKPYLHRTDNFHAVGSLADYMGIPSSRIVSNVQRTELSGTFYYMASMKNLIRGAHDRYKFNSIFRSVPGEFQHVGIHFKITEPLASDGKFRFSVVGPNPVGNSVLSSPDTRIGAYRVRHENGSIGPTGAGDYVTLIFDSAISTSQVSMVGKDTMVIIDGVKYYKTEFVISHGVAYVEAVNEWLNKNGACYGYFQVPISVAPWFGDPDVPYVDASEFRLSQTQNYVTVVKDEEGVLSIGVGGSIRGIRNKMVMLDYNVVSFGNNTVTPFMAADADTPPALPIDALFFRAYEFIGNYFFRNPDIDPFEINGQIPFDEYITNKADGADSTTPLEFWNVPYEIDMFTSCVKSPTFGRAPLVQLRGYTDAEGHFAEFHNVDALGNPYNVKLSYNADTGAVTAVSSSDEQSPLVVSLRDIIANNYGISIMDFENVSALQRFQDRMQRVAHARGSKYANFVKEFYGTNPPVGDHFPEYLGGVSQDINVNKLMNTGEQNNLGQFCGVGAIRSDHSDTIECFCSEDCILMGIVYLSVTPVYSQQLPRMFTKTDRMEYADPAFNNVTPQPVYAHQIAPLQLASGDLYKVFGFNIPFVEYRQMLDEAHGEFRSQSMHDYLIQRLFAVAPELGREFLYVKNEDVVNVFKNVEDNGKVLA